MTEPQVWTLIGVFAAIMLGSLTLSTGMIARVLRSEFGAVRTEIGSVRNEVGSVRNEIGSLRTEMRTEIGALRTEMHVRFTATDEKIAHLDRDVTALTRRVWGEPTSE